MTGSPSDVINTFSTETYEKAKIKPNKTLSSFILPSFISAKIFTIEQIKTSRMLNERERERVFTSIEGFVPPSFNLPFNIRYELLDPSGGNASPTVIYNYEWLEKFIKMKYSVKHYITNILKQNIAGHLPWIRLNPKKQVFNNEIDSLEGAFYTLNKIIYFKLPSKLSLLNGKLHNPKDGAVEYEHGLKIYYLNGVCVPKELVTTDEDKIDILYFIKNYKNVEIRRELLRKVGLDRFVSKTKAEIIDTWLDYDLLKLHIPNMRTSPIVLKMKNPSIECYHVEGVPNYIKTVQEALTWRCDGFAWQPKQLT